MLMWVRCALGRGAVVTRQAAESQAASQTPRLMLHEGGTNHVHVMLGSTAVMPHNPCLYRGPPRVVMQPHHGGHKQQLLACDRFLHLQLHVRPCAAGCDVSAAESRNARMPAACHDAALAQPAVEQRWMEASRSSGCLTYCQKSSRGGTSIVPAATTQFVLLGSSAVVFSDCPATAADAAECNTWLASNSRLTIADALQLATRGPSPSLVLLTIHTLHVQRLCHTCCVMLQPPLSLLLEFLSCECAQR